VDEVVEAADPPGVEVMEAVAPVPSSTKPGVITTGRLERRLWQRLQPEAGAMVQMSSGTADGAVAAIEAVLRAGADSLISFGVAAALAPAVAPGRLILGHAVVLPDGRAVATDPVWRRRLAGRLEALGIEPLEARTAGADGLSGSAAERFRCFQSTFAAVVDTESHVVAEAARHRGLPFVVLRVAVDCLREPALGGRLLGITAGGRWRRGLTGNLARPWLAGEAVRVSRDLDRALATLGRAVPILASSLAGGTAGAEAWGTGSFGRA
jgi:nucleoside phosphorylase